MARQMFAPKKSARWQLQQFAGDYLREPEAKWTLEYVRRVRDSSGSPAMFPDFLKQWYAECGYSRVKKAVKVFCPETNNKYFYDSPDVWNRYVKVIEKKDTEGVSLEEAVVQLASVACSADDVRAVLAKSEEELFPRDKDAGPLGLMWFRLTQLFRAFLRADAQT